MDRVEQNEQGLGFRRVGHGPAGVVLIHGWMTTGAVWDWTLEALPRSVATYLVPDLRGTGASRALAPPYDLATLARDVWGVVERAGVERPVLVGHSMGGQVAQLVAAEHPGQVAGLLLLNTVPASGLPLPDDALALFASAGGDADKLAAILDMATRELDESKRAALVRTAGSVPPDVVRELLEVWRRGGCEARLADIDAPTLVVSTDDPFLPSTLLDACVTSRIRGARREHMAGPGHYPLVERPAETAALIARFVATC